MFYCRNGHTEGKSSNTIMALLHAAMQTGDM